jgi:LysR family transcriptional regulator, nitrogen assimilation regulatory protein
MDIQLLETFLVVCEERNLSRAAVRLFRSQPAISRQLQALEATLGCQLLDRTSRGVRPTERGEELRGRAARILGELRGLKELNTETEGPAGDLVVACSDNVACHFLAPILGKYAAECPRVQIRLVSGVTPAIANLVERGSCELGFVLLPVRNARLELRPALDCKHVAVFPPGGGPKGLREMDLQVLCDMPLVLLTRETATRRSFDEMLASKGLQPRRFLEVGSVAVQKAMVRAGLGAGILPGYTLEKRDGLHSLPIQGARTHTLALCHLKTKAPSLPAKHLMKILGMDQK